MTDTNERQVNVPLLRKAVEWAEAEAAKPAIESRWVQEGWVSKPEHVARILLDETPWAWLGDEDAFVKTQQVAAHCGTAFCIAGWVGQEIDSRYAESVVVDDVHVEVFAARALGVSIDNELFDADNTIEDVRRIAESLAGERL